MLECDNDIIDFISDKIEMKRISNNTAVEFNTQFDSYCIICNKESTFQSETSQVVFPVRVGFRNHYNNQLKTFMLILFIYKCARSLNHKMQFLYRVEKGKIIKIGQFPSKKDLDKDKIKKYAKVLGDEKLGEYGSALGLYSHGVGIGSFIYLRRIIEYLINEEKTNSGIPTTEFAKLHVDQIINKLKDQLPRLLVDNHKIYGILSKGVHELSEEECLKYFLIIKESIELILDEKLEQMQKDKKIREIKIELNKIKGKVK